MDETIDSHSIDDNSEYKTPESNAAEIIEPTIMQPEYNKLNTIMIDAIAKKMGTPNADTHQISNMEATTTETFVPSQLIIPCDQLEEQTDALSEAQIIAKTDINRLDETAITPNRVQKVVQLTKETSVEEIPQLVFGMNPCTDL